MAMDIKKKPILLKRPAWDARRISQSMQKSCSLVSSGCFLQYLERKNKKINKE
jgi:hypothetical protein